MPTPAVLAYLDSMIGMFRAGGFSVDLTHHVMHALGSRMFGFTQELFDDVSRRRPRRAGRRAGQMAGDLPPHRRKSQAVTPTDTSLVGPGCDNQFEFEFALDLLLDGFERLRRQGWTSAPPPGDQVVA